MNIVSLIDQAISGAVGGNVAGAAMKDNSLGAIGNSIAGIVGGGLGGTLLQTVMGTAAVGGAIHPDGRCRHHQEQDGGKVTTLTSPTLIPN